ncbi:hypothetical protein FP435_06605 [Lactobacillus sp. PV037]|uniref:hypothetical protein n=1 Tax=Lactobacillus sp. PV037 TaxID=2594496 RepID=UPI00223EB054|nr:hypothetical protein [Lactobacillus sp. PV037]QNQ84113.1 hypothetical protein FP435_06605 [Lactobacillus sp. PV037]
MKYIINSTHSLGQKITAWISSLVDKSIGVTSSLNLIENGDCIIYLPSEQENIQTQINNFENLLVRVKGKKVNFMLINLFADQSNNPYVFSALYGYLQRRLAASSINYTLIRHGVLADKIVKDILEIRKNGKIKSPCEINKINFITANDVAHAVAKIATQRFLHQKKGQTYLLTAPQGYNMVELAYLLSQIIEEEIEYAPQDNFEASGIDLSLAKAASLGLLNQVSDDFQKVTGRECEDLNHFIRNSYQLTKLMNK